MLLITLVFHRTVEVVRNQIDETLANNRLQTITF